MRSIWITGFALLMVVCALFVSNAAGAPALPPLKVVTWVDKLTFGIGEQVTINYLVTRTADVTITIKKPDGTSVNIAPKIGVPGGIVQKQNVEASEPIGERLVTVTAKAKDGAQVTDTTSFAVQGNIQAFTLEPQDQGQQQFEDQGQEQQFVVDQGQEQFVDQGEGGQLVGA